MKILKLPVETQIKCGCGCEFEFDYEDIAFKRQLVRAEFGAIEVKTQEAFVECPFCKTEIYLKIKER